MITFGITGLRGHVHHARQATAVARRERRLVESHIANGRHIEGRKQTAEVVHLIDRIAVDEKQVLVVVATAHHHARQSLETGRNTGLHLQGLDQIDFAHDGRDAANLLGTQIIEAHHGIVHFVLSTPHNQGAIQFHSTTGAVGRRTAHRIRHDGGCRVERTRAETRSGCGDAQQQQRQRRGRKRHEDKKKLRWVDNSQRGTSAASGLRFFDYPLGSETAQYCKERNRHFLRILPMILLTAQN